MNNLSVGNIVSQGFNIGMKNMLSLIGAVFFWMITLWIPYINVGTTIALISIVPALSKGEMISPTEIFAKKYRKNMGEFFLALSFIYLGTIIGYIFLIIPGLVISIAWSLALYLLVDKDMQPMEAIKKSNNLTYGKKWTIFGGLLILSIILMVIVSMLSFIGQMISEAVGAVFAVISYLLIFPVILGAYAHIYKELTADSGETTKSPQYSPDFN